MKRFLDAYYEAMFFTEQDILEERGIWEYELSEAAKSTSENDTSKFLNSLPNDIRERLDESQLGHDFWLTRQGHGSGFWDGDYSKADEEILMEAVKPFKEVSLYNAHGFLQVE